MILSYLILWFSLSELNPLNWGRDLKNSFIKDFENAFFYFLSLLLEEILSAFSALFGLFDSGYMQVVSSIVYSVSLLGPASFPIFIVILTAIFAGLFLLLGLVKDAPVVGAIVG
jgi:hypothetical protein